MNKQEKRSKKIIDKIIEFSKHCRKCKHIRLSHMEGSRCISANGTTEQLIPCTCTEWLPEDNLDYIEWLARKRGFIK